MPQVQFSSRDKRNAKILVSILILASAVWFGETFRPFGVTERVVSYAAAQIEAEAVKVVDQKSNVPAKKAAPEKRPAPAPKPVAGKTYVAQKGDTVYGVAKRFGVHPETLKFANQIGSDNHIAIGQKLVIPQREG